MSIEDQIIVLTNTIAAIPPNAPAGTGYWLRRELDRLTRELDGGCSERHAAARAFAAAVAKKARRH